MPYDIVEGWQLAAAEALPPAGGGIQVRARFSHHDKFAVHPWSRMPFLMRILGKGVNLVARSREGVEGSFPMGTP